MSALRRLRPVFSTRRQGAVEYPDSGRRGTGPPWDRLYFRRDDAVGYWDGEEPRR